MATKSTVDAWSKPDLSVAAESVSSEAISLPDQPTSPQEKELPILTINAENDMA